jgi:hypothetical protein
MSEENVLPKDDEDGTAVWRFEDRMRGYKELPPLSVEQLSRHWLLQYFRGLLPEPPVDGLYDRGF